MSERRKSTAIGGKILTGLSDGLCLSEGEAAWSEIRVT
jgi:hypothetical protein